MKKIAILPLRKGSKSIKNKNRKKLLGRPLFTWVLNEAIKSDLDSVFVFTDDDFILDYVNRNYSWTDKVKAVARSEESATDYASTELAMSELVKDMEYGILVLLQATSPLTKYHDINKVLDLIVTHSHDSALTVVESKRFIWSKEGKSLNYEIDNRPRRQDFTGMLIENGAVYACKKDIFQKTNVRVGGKIGIHEMHEDTLYEIDEPNDWNIISEILNYDLNKEKQQPEKIKLLVIDVDGVFTDSNVAYTKDGEFSKSFSVRDGMGIELLKEAGIEVAIFTSENSEIVKSRMNKLKISDVFLGVQDKYSLLDDFLNNKNLRRQEVAYLGDDINDLANLISVGWSIVPSDAESEVKKNADIITIERGGDKFVRAAVSFILKYNNRFK